MDSIYMKLTFFNLLSFTVFAYKNVGNELDPGSPPSRQYH